MPHCLISFGSNLGDRFERIAAAGRAVAGHPHVRDFRASRLFETPAIGGPSGQSPFLNGVALIETPASARDVLAMLHQIEQQLGRQRAVRWDARSIDLDVVLYGDLQGDSQSLALPHPRYTARRFVLVPAAEIVGQWRDPRFGWSIQEMARHLDQGVPSLALVGGQLHLRKQLCEGLAERHSILTFTDPSVPIDATLAPRAPQAPGATEATEATGVWESPAPRPWVASFLPPLPPRDSAEAALPSTPRLIAHLQWTKPESRWPATHQIWKTVQDWPEYRLEVDSPEWAVNELASAILSMGCPLRPATADGLWYRG